MSFASKFLVAVAVACAPITAASCQQIPAATTSWANACADVPFKLFRGTRVVTAGTVNGHSVEMLLDSGAGVTVIDAAYARQIGLPKGMAIEAMGAGGTTAAELVSGVTLTLGGATFANATVAVMDMSPIAKALGRPMPVVLGRELFDNSVLTFDWERSLLGIADPKNFAAPAGARLLKLGRKDRLNTVEVSVAGLPPITAFLDLGAGLAMTLPKEYWTAHREIAGLKSADIQSGGVGGMIPARIVTVPRVDFGGERFTDVPVQLGVGEAHGAVKEAKVGINLLRQFRVTMDLGNDRLYLEPLASRVAFQRDRAGMRLDLDGDALVAAQVSPQGPAAAAGMKAGDRIVAVDGHRVGPDFYESAKSDWVRRPAGTPVALTLSDGRNVAFNLVDFY